MGRSFVFVLGLSAMACSSPSSSDASTPFDAGQTPDAGVDGGAPDAGAPDAGAALVITGAGVLDTRDLDGTEHFHGDLVIENRDAVTLDAAHILLATAGGWAFDLGDPIATGGSLLGIGPSLPAHTVTPLHLVYDWSSPATHIVLRLGAGSSTHAIGAAPIALAGATAPAQSPFADDVALTLQEPLEQIPLATGQPWLTVLGQVVNVSGAPLTLTSFSLTFDDGAGQALHRFDLTSSFPVVGSTDVLTPFLFVFVPPAGTAGVALSAELTVGGAAKTLAHSAGLTVVTARTVRSPVQGTWRWGNGQGETTLHTHFQFPEQRYAYDLLELRDGGSFSGDPTQNGSYFAFGQPFYAAESGKVVEVVDDVPDNFGSMPNPANTPKRNSDIIVQHADGGFAVYAHLKQGSALVSVGQQVAQGDALGAVGNAGFTTEPHLHFEQFDIDATGRMHALPTALIGATWLDGGVAVGVPVGDLELISP